MLEKMHYRAALFILLAVTGVRIQAQTTVFVSPTGGGTAFSEAAPGALSQVGAKVRTLNASMSGDITVYLRGGRYELPEDLTFGPADGGTNGHFVIYRAFAKERPVLSGGRILTGWTADANGGFQASVGGLRFRQLYINGSRAIRARYPNRDNDLDMGRYFWLKDWDVPGRRVRLDSASVGNWKDLSKIEFVVKSHWATARLHVGTLIKSGADAYLTPVEAERKAFFETPYFPEEPDQSFYFENAPEFLDAPGEWYLDDAAGTVHYLPRKGESANTMMAVAPVIERLIHFQGTSHIRMEGLILEHTTWLEGDRNAIIDPQGAWKFPASVHIENSSYIRLVGNFLRHTAAEGVVFGGDTHDNVLDGNSIYDIGANGILFITSGSRNDTARNNSIELVGREHSGALGILAQLTDHAVLEKNEIWHAPYGGIDIGWDWFKEITAANGNVVRANHIHQVMELHDDAAGVYTLGRMDGSVIERNYIHDVQRSRWAERFSCSGIYLDEGSMGYTIRDNVLEGLEEPLHENTASVVAGENAYSNNNGHDALIISQAGPDQAFRKIPHGSFKVDKALGPLPLTVTTDASASNDDVGITDYQWDFGDGVTASGKTASHIYTSPGTYILMLRVFDQDTLYDYASMPIQVNVGAGSVNLALKKPATASSNFSSGGQASAGNDGDINTIWASAVVDPDVHWQVDFGKPERIYQLEMVSRQDGDQVPSRQNFEVRGSNTPDFATSVVLGKQGPTIFPARGTWFAAVSDTGKYRYLRVVKPANVHFHFAELRAYGAPAVPVAIAAQSHPRARALMRARVREGRFTVEKVVTGETGPAKAEVRAQWDGVGKRAGASR